MDTDRISDDDLLKVIRHAMRQVKAGKSRRFDLQQADRIIKELTDSADRSPAH